MTTPENTIAQEIRAGQQSRTVEEIETWLSGYLAKLLDRDVDEIDPEVPFERHGLDSAAAISMMGDLENWLGLSLDAAEVYNFPTINALARHIVGEE